MSKNKKSNLRPLLPPKKDVMQEQHLDDMYDYLFALYKISDKNKQQTLKNNCKADALKKGITEYQYVTKLFEQSNKKPPNGTAQKRPTAPATPPPPPENFPWNFESTSLTPKANIIVPSDYKPPVVHYTPHAKATIDYLVANNSREVGWLGTVKRTDNVFLIEDIYVPAQTVSSVETLIDQNAMSDLWEEIFAAGGDPSTLIYWGHSHVNMEVGPSAQDELQIRRFLKGCTVFIRGIYNKKGASKVDVYDIENRIVTQCVQNTVAFQLADSEIDHLKQLMSANVKTYTPPPVAPQQQTWGWGKNQFNPYQALEDDEHATLLQDPFYVGNP